MERISIEYGWFLSTIYGVITAGAFFFDVLTFPIYFVIHNPVRRLQLAKSQRADIIDKKHDYITLKTTKKPFKAHEEIDEHNIETMAELFDYIAQKQREKRCLGTRQILGEEDEQQPNGKVFKKFNLGEYTWLTFTDVDRLSSQFGRGLRRFVVHPRQPIAILAETRAKWMVAAQAAFKHGIPLVTIYVTLGDEAIAHAINETEVEVVITSFALLPKFRNILNLTPNVKTLIYMEDHLEKLENVGDYKEDVTIVAFDDVIQDAGDVEESRPNAEDTAIIMYTSGSTGIPKGVKLLHKNMVASVKAFMDCTPMNENEVVLGYLPLAHVFELIVEVGMMFLGMKIGYSSSLTMIDTASKIKRGTNGDATELKPTFMCSVPLILDRISKAIREKVNNSNPVKKMLFDFGYNYKNRWLKWGFQTPLIDLIVFRATKNILGGDLHLMAVGGAPLTRETHELIRVCLGVDALQGYGLTETCACAANQDAYDLEFERVGPPMTMALVRIANWDEGNYFVTDKPNPRGEIIIGGDMVSPGYFKNEEKTKEEFFEDDGIWWFRTGDIGEVHKDGSIKIIDRKKDIVKLQAGEYISLGKIEALLVTHRLIDNICVYADSTKSYCVALIVANQENLIKLASERLNKNGRFEQLCDDPDVTKTVLKAITEHGSKVKLQRFEIPEKIILVKDVWLPETGLVTATFKLKRKEIQKYYATVLQDLYR